MVNQVPNHHAGQHAGITFAAESLVDASAFNESKITSILAKYRSTGLMPQRQRRPMDYDPAAPAVDGDFTAAQNLVHEAADDMAALAAASENKVHENASEEQHEEVTQPEGSAEGAPART